MIGTPGPTISRTIANILPSGSTSTVAVAAQTGVAVAADYFQSYSVVGLLAAVGVLFVAVAFGAGRLLRPEVPTREKLLTYECGVDPVGEGWAHTQVRYYVYASSTSSSPSTRSSCSRGPRSSPPPAT